LVRRLFIFAIYSGTGVVPDYTAHYAARLAELGDVAVCADSDYPESELSKIRPLAKTIINGRHGEYDFGSYKRGYLSADTGGYDWVYLCNDSVYGPAQPLGPILERMESGGPDAWGMSRDVSVVYKPGVLHLQSWFVGLNKRVANSDYFRDFITGVGKQPDKECVVVKYELGLSEMLCVRGCKIDCLFFSGGSNAMFNNPIQAFDAGVPFVKRNVKAATKFLRAAHGRADIPDEFMNFIRSDFIGRRRQFRINAALFLIVAQYEAPAVYCIYIHILGLRVFKRKISEGV
jgi:lipopolysaccharide biosynthesis protein